MEWGAWLIALILGLGLLTREVQRILSLPLRLDNFLYLVLLLSVSLLIGGWKWVSQKELGLLCEWLDPRDYTIPEETIVIVGISAALGILLLTARQPVFFGVAYVLYCSANLAAWLHFKNKLMEALRKSRARLDEGAGLPGAETLYSAALDYIEKYYVLRPHTFRLLTILILAVFGLISACYGAFGGIAGARIASYAVYIFAVLAVEVIIITCWRLRYYSDLHHLAAELSERLRTVSGH